MSDKKPSITPPKVSEEHRWRALFEYSPDACYLYDLQGRFLEGNQAAERMVGYERTELIGKSFLELDLLDKPGVELCVAVLSRNAAGMGTGPDEFRLRRKDGATVVAEVRTYPLQLEDRWVVLGTARDVTSKKRMEAELRASEERYRQVFESVNDAIYIRPIEGGNFVEVNGVACKRLGYTRDELLRRSPLDISPIATPERLKRHSDALLRGNGVIFQTAHITKDGRTIPVEVSCHIADWNGKQVLLSVARDLTERRVAEAVLRESERRFREMLENVRLCSLMLDDEGKILFINSYLLDLIGRSLEDVLSRNWFDLFIPESQVCGARKVFAALLNGTAYTYYENEVIGKNGPRLISWNNTSLRDSTGKIIGVTSIGEDITDRRKAEEALRASEMRFHAVVESGPSGIFIQTDSVFAYLNSRAAKLLGATSPEELAGSLVLDRFHPDSRRQIEAGLTAMQEGHQPLSQVEHTCVKIDGSSFPAEVAGVPFKHDGRPAGLVFFNDITARKELERKLQQAARMEAIGQLAGGVAHDFNNVLSAVLMHLGLLQQRADLPCPVMESFREIEQEVMRAAQLSRQLLMFSRRQAARPEKLDLNTLVNNLLKMLRRLLGETVTISFEPAPCPVWVVADPGMLEQVLTNLCINARDAMKDGGLLTVDTSVLQLAPDESKKQSPSAYARLRVTDTGCGMDEGVMSKLFEPFFTTKSPGKGTGLGLATVHSIVKQHNGWIDVASTPSKGSTFSVLLPFTKRTARNAPESSQSEEVKGGSETILLVEDEVALRRSAAMCLRKLGYGVLEAENGKQALEISAEHRGQIALVLSDQVLPEGMSGNELIQRLKSEAPELQAILSSGYSAELARLRLGASNKFTYLAKPYRASTLARVVRECLDRRQPRTGAQQTGG